MLLLADSIWSWEDVTLLGIPALLLLSLAIVKKGKSFTAILGLIGMAIGAIANLLETKPPYLDHTYGATAIGALIGLGIDNAWMLKRPLPPGFPDGTMLAEWLVVLLACFTVLAVGSDEWHTPYLLEIGGPLLILVPGVFLFLRYQRSRKTEEKKTHSSPPG